MNRQPRICVRCKKQYQPNSNSAKFCSLYCQRKEHHDRWKATFDRMAEEARQERGRKTDNKIQCLICGLWYRQVGTHVVQIHKITARKYRELYELEVKRGLLPDDYRALKGRQAVECGGIKNLEKGKINVGNYKRSPITLERIRGLNRTRK
jgi:hypothetical protein